jgi:glycosyltransferase involved in cell wall biosynthesis
MKLSVIIATYNRPNDIKNTLDSVFKQTLLPYELIIVDQSTDETTRLIVAEYETRIAPRKQAVKYIKQEKPSLVQARNRGAQEAGGDIICYIDDDIVLFEDYFQKIEAYFHDSSIGGVSGNVVIDKGLSGFKWELRKILLRVFLLNDFRGHMTSSTFGYPICEREINGVMEVDMFPGYSMNFRRELVLRNKCDEWFSGYSFREDVDLSYRISRGAKLIMVPDARFVHNNSSINRLDYKRLKQMQFKNYYYLFVKFKKKSLFSSFLFGYSIFGTVFIDFIEYIFNLNQEKWNSFSADVSAVLQLMKGKL